MRWKNKKSILALFIGVILVTVIAGCTTTKEPVKEPAQEENNMSDVVTFKGELPKSVTDEATFTGASAVPNFTEEQIAEQIEAGKRLVDDIYVAARDENVKTYVIPAGNYGFDEMIEIDELNSQLVFRDINRTDDNPLTIKAEGVTFWFANARRCLHFMNCSNIIIEDLTLDEYQTYNIEGTIYDIDVANNRIGVKPYEDCIELTEEVIQMLINSPEFRMINFKKNGDMVSTVYDVNDAIGPRASFFKNLTVDDNGICWFTFKTEDMLSTVTTKEWKEFYGEQGCLEVGDPICVCRRNTISLALDNCRKMQMINLKNYITKGGLWENGGYGDHLWKDCYCGPRPGTQRLLGGEGGLSQGCRVGPVYDGCYYKTTTDDSINIHGFWSKVSYSQQVEDGYEVKFNFAPVGIEKGDKVLFYNDAGLQVATCTVKETPLATYNYNGFLTSNILLEENVPNNYVNLIAYFPNSQCEGFTIKNCIFENVYQRCLINSGSGTVENNLFINCGNNLALTSNIYSYEGGIMHDITVKNNLFVNTGNHPGGTAITLYQSREMGLYVSAKNIDIEDNVFVNCGALIDIVNAKDVTLKNNIVIEPLVYREKVTDFKQLYSKRTSSFTAFNGNTAYVVGGSNVSGENAIKNMSNTNLEQILNIAKNRDLSVEERLVGIKAICK